MMQGRGFPPGGPPFGGRGPMGFPGGGAFLCNICQQPGHKAEMCPNGQVDWIKKLGLEAFRMYPNRYWSEDPVNPANRRIVYDERLAQQAKAFAAERLKEQGTDYSEVAQVAERSMLMTEEQIGAIALQLQQKRNEAVAAAAGVALPTHENLASALQLQGGQMQGQVQGQVQQMQGQGGATATVSAKPTVATAPAVAAKPAEDVLPTGWYSTKDPQGRVYYYTADGRTSWIRPTAPA